MNIEPDPVYTVLDLFLQQVTDKPHHISVEYQGDTLTYLELDERSNQLAHYLLDKGVMADSRVGICMHRSSELIVAILATLKIGAAFVPIDPEYPQDRINYILNNVNALFVLTAGDASEKLQSNVGNEHLFSAIALDAAEKQIRSQRTAPVTGKVTGDHLAYVIYTSGSTGRPKGVLIAHRSLLNYISWAANRYVAGRLSTFALYTSISFDLTITSIFVPLITGNLLSIYQNDTTNLLIENVFTDRKANVIKLTPSHLRIVSRSEAIKKSEHPDHLTLIVGGEELETSLAREIHQLFHGKVAIYNEYGPTEATVGCMIHQFNPAEELSTVPIGIPIDNCNIYLLDPNLQQVSQGDLGEIFIAGDCLATGYYGNDTLTNERFVPDPFVNGNKMYKTGDHAVMLENGLLLYKGRADDQVKLRGYRIELGEIEHQLLLLEAVKDAVVIVRHDLPGGPRLVSYVTITDEKTDTGRPIKSWKNDLRKHLPDYMIPGLFVILPALPLTINGKVDKDGLPRPESTRPDSDTLYKEPSTDTEKQIVATWEELLSVHGIGIYDNFFELGGNSLLALAAVAFLKDHYSLEIPITKLYQYPTAAELDTWLNEKKPSWEFKAPNPIKSSDEPIAIVGMAGRFPGADTIDELWDLLIHGVETTTFFSPEEIDPFIPPEEKEHPDYVRARGVVNAPEWFDAELFGLNPVTARLMDPQHRIFLEICREALESSGHLPVHYTGTLGVYAGCAANTYYTNNVLSNQEEIDKIGAFQTTLLNEKDFLTSRVAYQLDLKGPAVSVYSACSTSLLAVAQAVDAIRNGQCEAALAGGISITVPVNSGHMYQEGAILSNDGHCRPFDASGKGTVFSDGAGVVLLKSLELAKKHGDTIFAVIKGTGVSNDGAGKGSFTAPHPEGQATAIAMALHRAGVDPQSISYVEAHGTATPIGDPIEIEGLKLAYGETDKKQYCKIGSIKSNMGHLTHAAGVAGLIKTALSLRYKTIPASINYREPNPAIDFSNSPFKVNDQTSVWESNGIRRAGVSSFGVGGTNVHLVLEEYPDEPETPTPSPAKPVLLTWSAKSEISAVSYAEKLLDYLVRRPDVSLPDVAYTLWSTRQEMSVRHYLTAADYDDLINKLRSKAWSTYRLTDPDQNVAFMFPGQGAQYVGMGQELYHSDQVYREAVDACAAVLTNVMGEDIRQVIFSDGNSGEAAQKLKNTYYTQPAIFVTSYALAKFYQSKGVEPVAFIGHSVGEFVAAHLSGIFSLADALKLIAIRGKLISKLERGSMLSVRRAANEVIPTLPQGLSLAAINAPNLCVVAGPEALIQHYKASLEKEQIAAGLLHTSHAFHSDMMDPILDEFMAAVKTVPLSTPKKPLVSTVTGQWMKDSEATDATYWVSHLKSTVKFSDALQLLCRELNPVLLEVGPGNVTATLARQHGQPIASKTISGLEAGSAYVSLLNAVGKLWTNGIDVDRDKIFGKNNILFHLPTYAYDKKYYWLNPAALPTTGGYQQTVPVVEKHIPPATSAMPDPHKASGKDQVTRRIKELLNTASGIAFDETNQSATFVELGLDSLLLTQIASTLKKEFNVAITFRKLNESYYNLALLSAYISESQPEQQQRVSSVSSPEIHEPDTAIHTLSMQVEQLSRQIAQLTGNDPSISDPSEQRQTSSGTKEDHPREDYGLTDSFNQSPFPRARLGKDINGNPGWFIADENRPGKFMQVVLHERI